MCEHRHHYKRHGPCCCRGPFEHSRHRCHQHHDEKPTFQRMYQTKEEQVAELETYLNDLKLEVQAVEELLVDLRR